LSEGDSAPPARIEEETSMRTLLLGAASLYAAGFLASAALAQEVWQTLPEPPPMPEPAESGMAPVNDIEMYYAVYGEGEPVLLIHGGLGHADVWGFPVPALAEDHKVIVADSRGHGRSTRSEQTSSPCSIISASIRSLWSAGAMAASSASTSPSATPSG
jgi:hypothetical protein